MQNIKNNLFIGCLLLALFTLATACSEWNEPKTVNLEIKNAKEQNPELWTRYMESLRKYKESKHFISYARFENATENPKNEGGYLRSLPDSLDIVVLGNSDNISDFDREDIPLLQEKSTRVLLLVDYAQQAAELADTDKLAAYLDKAVAKSSELNLDGFVFTGIPLYGGTEAELASEKEKAKLIISKLSAAAGKNKLLVFEGEPAFLPNEELAKLNYLVLNTEEINNITDLKLKLVNVFANSDIAKEKLLITAKIGNQISDEENIKQNAIVYMSNAVAALGPLAGLSICAIGDDYYQPKMNYETCRRTIQLMNPSK